MTTEYSGAGDPLRSMALLWRSGERQPSPRGSKPGLSVDRIVVAAIEIGDAEGLSALSMRRVADRLDVGTMSLYTYVPGKAELIDVMIDTVLGEVAHSADVAGGWRERLEHVARENWALFLRHAWILQVATTARPPMGPNVLAKYDYELRTLEGTGLSDVEIDSCLTLVLGFVQGAARLAVETAAAESVTGRSDLEWWEANAPLLEKVFDASKFPTAARVGAAAGEAYQAAFDPQLAFEFGLARVLDGIAVLIDQRA